MIARRTLLSGVVSLGIAMTVEAAVPDGGPEATARAFVGAWNAHDMTAMEAVFSADADWINVVGMYWQGRDQIMGAQRFFHAGIFQHNQQELRSVQSRMLGPDVALVMIDCLQDEYRTPSGHVMPQALDRLSLVVVRQSAGWRITHGQNTIVDARAASSDPVLHMPAASSRVTVTIEGTPRKSSI